MAACVNEGSSKVTNVLLSQEILTTRKSMHVWMQEVYGKSASSVKYCYEYKTTLKNKVYFLKCLMGDL